MNDIIDQKTAVVAYHSPCIDGFTSAWVMYNILALREGYKVKLIPMKYTKHSIDKLFERLEELNIEHKLTNLYVVDYSLDMPYISKLQVEYPEVEVMILDHHKTAFERYAPEITKLHYDSRVAKKLYNTQVILDNNESGASLCYKTFCSSIGPVPELVSFIKDYDLWRFSLGEETKWINKYLMEQDKTLANWSRIHTCFQNPRERREILEIGSKLQAEHDKKVREVVVLAVGINLQGYPGLSVECSRELTSDVGHTLALNSGAFGACYSIDTEANTITWSLRSNGDFDVSDIAKEYGGGGHKNAAGFTTAIVHNIEELGIGGGKV